jgi:hypothetical protein
LDILTKTRISDTTSCKIQLRYNIDLSRKVNIKLLEENLGANLCKCGIGKDFLGHKKNNHKEEKNKLDLIKVKNMFFERYC